jgi:hypothetical protein
VRTSRGRIARVAAALATIGVGVSVTGAGASFGDYATREPTVWTHGVGVRAERSTFCVEFSDQLGGQCVDYLARTRPPRARLPVAPRDKLRLVFGDNPNIRDRPESVHVSLARIEDGRTDYRWSEKAHRIRGSSWRWAIRLPADLHHANDLPIFADFNGGEASFDAGIKRR